MFLFFKVMNLLITEIIMMIIYTIMIFHKTSVVIRCQSEKLCKDLVHVKKRLIIRTGAWVKFILFLLQIIDYYLIYRF